MKQRCELDRNERTFQNFGKPVPAISQRRSQTMKQESKLLLSLLHGAGVGAVLLSGGSLISTDAVAQIAGTKHNLAGATGNRVTGGATGEICVFCHTPHGADTGQPIPLWNKFINTATVYTTYAQLGTSTLDANANNGSVATGSISVACLSCHDGTQAMDNMLNTPGSGASTLANGGGVNGQTGATWAWGGTTVNAEGILTSGAALLGADLRNDHPIGVAYCGGNNANHTTLTTTACRDSDFKAITVIVGAGGAGAADAQYYIETGAAAGKDKSDLQLYTRAFGGAQNFKPSVECGSCHDPHVQTKAANQTAFLRVSQASSGLCLACHNK
jgi:predicted CXXCH cytochrome family protein